MSSMIPPLVVPAVSQSRRRFRRRRNFDRPIPQLNAPSFGQSPVWERLRRAEHDFNRRIAALHRSIIDPVITSPRILKRMARIHILCESVPSSLPTSPTAADLDALQTLIIRIHGALLPQPGSPPLISSVSTNERKSSVDFGLTKFFSRISMIANLPNLPVSRYQAQSVMQRNNKARTSGDVAAADGWCIKIPNVSTSLLDTKSSSIRVNLYPAYSPPRVKCSKALSNVLGGIESGTVPQILSAFWDYISSHSLTSDDDCTVVKCDPALFSLFDRGDGSLTEFPISNAIHLLRKHFSSMPPISCLLRLSSMTPTTPFAEICADVMIDLPDPLHAHLCAFHPMRAPDSKEIEEEKKIESLIESLLDADIQKRFYDEARDDPIRFLHSFCSSQDADLGLMFAEGIPNPEIPKFSIHYSHPWMGIAASSLLSKERMRKEIRELNAVSMLAEKEREREKEHEAMTPGTGTPLVGRYVPSPVQHSLPPPQQLSPQPVLATSAPPPPPPKTTTPPPPPPPPPPPLAKSPMTTIPATPSTEFPKSQQSPLVLKISKQAASLR